MIKVDTSDINDGNINLNISGDPITLATETLALIACIRDAIQRRMPDKEQGEIDRLFYEMVLLKELPRVIEDESLAKAVSKNRIDKSDIKSADLGNNEDDDFLKWLRGVDDN